MSETTEQPDIPPHDPDIKHMSDDINTPVLVVAVFVTAVIVLISIFGVQAFYYYLDGRDLANKSLDSREGNRYVQANDLQNQQTQKLTRNPRWIDRDKGRVSIPIEDAMRLVVEELRTEQSAQQSAEQSTGSGQPEGESGEDTGDGGESE